MKYVNANDTTHVLKLILRDFNPIVDLILYDEFTQIEYNTNDGFFLTTENGISTITFDFEFKDGDSYQFKMVGGGDRIYYRGKIKAIL